MQQELALHNQWLGVQWQSLHESGAPKKSGTLGCSLVSLVLNPALHIADHKPSSTGNKGRSELSSRASQFAYRLVLLLFIPATSATTEVSEGWRLQHGPSAMLSQPRLDLLLLLHTLEDLADNVDLKDAAV